ncbi:MAG TPA: hypothetical protein ENK57_21920 [Polyangiaceae bacterium]|nr:hypothetical protein [Polyangiaceae bacterium]
MTHPNKITDAKAAFDFILAGRAICTFLNPATGGRFTYRVRVRDEGPAFVDVITGSGAEDFTRLGLIFEGKRFVVPRAWEIGNDAPSAAAFRWVFARLSHGADLRGVEVWHEGRCGACNRPLRVPESIETGLGPICAKKHAA